MGEPEFLICTECETPCYTFDWDENNYKPMNAMCTTCGNESKETFETEEAWAGEE